MTGSGMNVIGRKRGNTGDLHITSTLRYERDNLNTISNNHQIFIHVLEGIDLYIIDR